MRSKYCKDRLCERAGELLPLDDFPRNRMSKDRHYLFCKECCRRRSRESYGKRTGYKAKVIPRRKPMLVAINGLDLSKVYDAIRAGFTTREQIQRRTQLDYETIGLALCELVFEAKGVRIEHRKFVLNDVESVAA